MFIWEITDYWRQMFSRTHRMIPLAGKKHRIPMIRRTRMTKIREQTMKIRTQTMIRMPGTEQLRIQETALIQAAEVEQPALKMIEKQFRQEMI